MTLREGGGAHQLEGHVVEVGGDVGECKLRVAVHGDLPAQLRHAFIKMLVQGCICYCMHVQLYSNVQPIHAQSSSETH